MTGLRRFAQPAPAKAPPAAARPPADQRCDLCAAAVPDVHGHVVALADRALRCACRACHLLFTVDGAGRGRFRSVPDRYRHDPRHPVTDADWADLRIPVGTAFLFVNSDLARVVACYPSPGGATECLLDLAAWDRLREDHPLLAAAAPDVEAIFVHTGGNADDAGRETFLVPIDACYRLVGAIRTRWRGLDGGAEVRRTLTAFVTDLRARSRPFATR